MLASHIFGAVPDLYINVVFQDLHDTIEGVARYCSGVICAARLSANSQVVVYIDGMLTTYRSSF